MQGIAASAIASPAKRLGGYVLDVLYSGVAMFVLSAITQPEGDGSGFVGLFFIAYFVVSAWFWSKGTSPGKMTLGMYVYSQDTGERLGFWTMLLRETIGKWLSGLIFGLGYLWILLDENKQGWHDKLVSSVVLDTSQ